MTTELYIGSHPDDVELGCGGTMIKSIGNGNRVIVAFFSKGEKGLVASTSHDRVDESKKALLSIGVKEKDIHNFDIPDTHFTKHRNKIFKYLEKLCQDYKVDSVYTHSSKEYHQDHQVISDETLRAARDVSNIYLYESNAHTYSSYAPVLFVDISKFLTQKLKLLKHHISQKDRDYFSPENIKSLAKFRGNQSRVSRYSEAFEIFRSVK